MADIASGTFQDQQPNGDAMWRAESPVEARAHLLDSLRREVLGPESDHEILRESPLTRYIVGLLAPFGTEIPEEERDEEVADGDEDELESAPERSVPISQSLTPSSIGLSFLVDATVTSLEASVGWGEYSSEDEKEEEALSAPDRPVTDAQAQETQKQVRRRTRRVWIRKPHAVGPKSVRLREGQGLQKIPLGATGLSIEHITRRVGSRLAVSLFIVNRRSKETGSRPPLDRWIFQPVLSVSASSDTAIFLPREVEGTSAQVDPDHESNRLLYRSRREFAIGHGCAAEWTLDEQRERARTIRTELIPSYELPRVTARGEGANSFEMSALAAVRSVEELQGLVHPLLDEYEQWIKQKRQEAEVLIGELRQVALLHVDDCERVLRRIVAGLAVLAEDPDAFAAFRFANHAMLLQRSHSVWSAQRRKNPIAAPAQPELVGAWRPFQLAFFLLNIEGIARPESNDRQIGDLLWFPTGGGKTEAYLGLAAFTMALRRRRLVAGMRTDAGVTVLMRYTLRLLTIQQFQRASTLLCACELLRREAPGRWGDYRFSIGLWLGQTGTPNTHDDSRRALTRLQVDPSEEGANPCVLESCPWCGEVLRPRDYWIDGERHRTLVACSRDACPYSRRNSETGIPVLSVDEELYRECPALLIATVDKFAQMPWNAEVQSIFGYIERECDRCGFLTASSDHGPTHRGSRQKGAGLAVRRSERLAPPDLIIQDELHLISGPLGTLVGLYETAVDFLASRRGVGRWIRPKVVASTATVRRAFEQVQAIFDRTLRVFPPPGLSASDSFFAVEEPISDMSPGRLYVGVSAPGKSMKTAYIRVAASLLSSAAGLRSNPSAAEPYLTLVSYFNSLRELGGARRLLDDDVPARLDQLRVLGRPQRHRPVYDELTSRVRQEAIPQLLRRLEQRHDGVRAADGVPPLDVVLASNMISVGVDVDRLGMMTVTGQPKTTAEYIQATSRVGRQSWGPGLVVTLYNWSRPRDLSHYERFRHYHSALYRGVEAVSATPFSSRALDRGLRGVYVSMVRLGSESLSPELGASAYDPATARVQSAAAVLRSRAEAVAGQPAAAAITTAAKALSDQWWSYKTSPLRYSWRTHNPDLKPREDVLLKTTEPHAIGHWEAPQSLREVEELSYVRVLGLDEH